MRNLRNLLPRLARLLVDAYFTVCFLIQLMSRPFINFHRWIRKKLGITRIGGKLDRYDSKFRHFNGLVSFCLFILSGIYALVLLLIKIGDNDALSDYFMTLVLHTPVGSFFGFFIEGLNFTPATAVSIAFSGTLFSACMGDDEPDGFAGFLIRLLRHIVFFVGFAHLAVLLSQLFQIIGDWGYNTLIALFNAQTGSFFSTVGNILLLLVIGYPAIVMFLLAIKEYAECIFLGILVLLFVLLVTILMKCVFNWPDNVQTIVTNCLVFLGFFGVDLFRPYIDNMIYFFLKQYSSYPQDLITKMLDGKSQKSAVG